MTEQHYQLNGTDLYLTTNEHLHTFCVAVYLYAGSMYESERDNGISHLYEHTVFRNLKRMFTRDFYELLSERGVFLNGCTYKEFMQFSLYGVPEGFGFAMDILNRLFLPLELSPEEFRAEKGRVRAEIREEDAGNSLYFFHGQAVWNGTSLARDIAGKWGTVSEISLKRLNAFRDTVVSAGNLFVYGTGCIDEAMQESLLRTVSELPISPQCLNRCNLAPVPEGFRNRSGSYGIKHSDSTLVALSFDVDCTRTNLAERDVLYSAMFLNEDAAIDRALSEKLGMIYSYDSWQEQYCNISRFCLIYEIAPKNLLLSLETAAEAIRSVKAGDFNFEVNRRKLLTGSQLILDSSSDYNWSLAYDGHILGGFTPDFDRPALGRYDKLQKAAVVEAAGEVFVPRNLTVSFKGKKTGIDTDAAREILEQL